MAGRTKTVRDIAELLEVHPTTVHKYIQKGCPHDKAPAGTKQSAMLDENEVVLWLKANNLTGKLGKPKGPQSAEKEALEIRKLTALVEKAERENALSAGKLIDAEQERARDLAKLTAIKTKLDSLGASLAPMLTGMDASEIQTEIEKAINSILKQLSQGE